MIKQELPKAYDFKSTEPRIYEMWEKGGYFQPFNDPNKPDFDPNVEPFVISIPPPNCRPWRCCMMRRSPWLGRAASASWQCPPSLPIT